MAAMVVDSPTRHTVCSQAALVQYQMSLGAAMAPAGENVCGRSKKILTRSQSVLPNLLLPPESPSSHPPLERPPKSPGYEVAPSRKKLCRADTLTTGSPLDSCGQRQSSVVGTPPRPNRREFRRQRTVGDMFQLVLGRGKSHLSSLFRRESSAKKSSGHVVDNAADHVDGSAGSDAAGKSADGAENGSDVAGRGHPGGELTSSFSSCPDLINAPAVAMDTSASLVERRRRPGNQGKPRMESRPSSASRRHLEDAISACASQSGQSERESLDRATHNANPSLSDEGRQSQVFGADHMEVHDLEMSDVEILSDSPKGELAAGSAAPRKDSLITSRGGAFVPNAFHQDSKGHQKVARTKTMGAWEQVPSINVPVPSLNTPCETPAGSAPTGLAQTRTTDCSRMVRRNPGTRRSSGSMPQGLSSPKATSRPRATSAGLDKRVEMCGLEVADLQRCRSVQGLTAESAVSQAPPSSSSSSFSSSSSSASSIAKFMSESVLTSDAAEACLVKTALHKSKSLGPEAGSGTERRASATSGEGTRPQGQSISRVLDFLYLGTLEAASNEPLLCKLNVAALLDLSNARSHRVTPTARRGNECPCACFGRRHFRSRLNIAVDDIEWENLAAYFDDINSFLEGCRRGGRSVLVFSYHGKSRGPTAVAQYLIKHHNFTLAQALAHLRACKTEVAINSGFYKALRKLDQQMAEERAERSSQDSVDRTPSPVTSGLHRAPVPTAGSASHPPAPSVPSLAVHVPDVRRPTVRDAWADL